MYLGAKAALVHHQLQLIQQRLEFLIKHILGSLISFFFQRYAQKPVQIHHVRAEPPGMGDLKSDTLRHEF